MSEYAFQGYRHGVKECWADAYPRLGDARRAAKTWVDRTPGKTAVLLVRAPRPSHHEYGARWETVGALDWKT